MCFGGGADIPEQEKPDPIVKDEDENKGSSAIAARERSKVAALYGEDSMRATGSMGLPGGAATAGKKVTGA